MSVARLPRPLVSQLIQDSSEPNAGLFEIVRQMSIHADGKEPGLAYQQAIDGGHWIDATHLLLREILPATGFMAGLLPDGSAHARIMARVGGRLSPFDAFRNDHVSLALLEAMARALEHGPAGHQRQ